MTVSDKIHAQNAANNFSSGSVSDFSLSLSGSPNEICNLMEKLHTFPVLETTRLELVEIQQKHLADLFLLFGDEKVTRYYNIKTFRIPEEGRIYLDWFRTRFKEGAGIRWAIRLKGKESLIGTIGYNNFTQNHRANLGYDLRSAYWNKGYMTEAAKAVITFGFNHLLINRIEAEVMQGNRQAEQLLSKLGFTNEGCLRDWMYWDNRHFDMTMFSLLKKEWSYFPNFSNP